MAYIGSGISRFNTADELTVTGDAVFNGDANFGDNDKAIFGAGSDLSISHNGSYSLIADSGTGNLILACQDFSLTNPAVGENMITAAVDGAVTLFHDNAAKLATASTGISVTGNATFADNGKAIFGAGSDLQIYHDGSNSYIDDTGNGDMLIRGSARILLRKAGTTENMIRAEADSYVKLYYDNAEKLATTATGVDVTGGLKTTGNVGIATGASAIDYSLVVKGSANTNANILAVKDSDNTKMMSVEQTSNGDGRLFVYDTAGNADILLHTNGSSYFNGGKVGIGTASPTLDGSLAGLSVSSSGTVLHVNDGNGASLKLTDPAIGANRGFGISLQGTEAVISNCESGALRFGTGNTERMRITSAGSLLVAQSASDTPGISNTTQGAAIGSTGRIHSSVNGAFSSFNRNSSDGGVIQFHREGNKVGEITVNSSSTAYGTSSDRRLKSNIQDAASASDKIDAIQVRQFDWNVDDSHQDYGLIAQELQPIEPLAVTGSADSDEMMGVDYSKLVPMLIKEIQELRSRVATLEAN